MADSNSTAPRCPCGFWGTPQTGGLCSKCHKEKEKKLGATDCGAASTSGATTLPTTDLNTPLEQAMSSSSIQDIENGSSGAKALAAAKAVAESLNTAKEEAIAANLADKSDDSSQDGSSGEGNGANKRDISEVQDSTELEFPVQKNKKRCFKCNCKLELALREIGKCKCNYVFCQLHRLPEQHECVYDHKEKGRKAAREKMVSPKKHAGTSIKRMDSCS